MARKHRPPTKQTDDGGLAAVLSGDAVAVGLDTQTSVEATVRLVDRPKVDLARGQITATAVAEGAGGEMLFTSATTDVAVAGADLVVALTRTLSYSEEGTSYTRSITRFIAIDIDGIELGQLVINLERDRQARHDPEPDPSPSGNLATLAFDATATGENTFIDVRAETLAIEDRLSLSTLVIEGAVA